MVKKKDQKTTKLPEQSISSKINYYKGETRTLRKRIGNLEKRVLQLEQQIVKLLPKKVKKDKCIKTKDEKFREEFLEKHYPGGKIDD